MSKKNKFWIPLLIIVLVVAALFGGVFSIVTVADDVALEVEDYVCKGCTVNARQEVGTFNESASFDLAFTRTKTGDDATVWIIDASGDKKQILKSPAISECQDVEEGAGGTALQAFDFGRVTVENNDVSLRMVDGEGTQLGLVTKTGSFGEEPYTLMFNVFESRSKSVICKNRGSSYRQGKILASNIILNSYESEEVVEQPVVVEEPVVEEPVEDEPFVEEVEVLPVGVEETFIRGDEVTANVVVSPVEEKNDDSSALLSTLLIGLLLIAVFVYFVVRKNKGVKK